MRILVLYLFVFTCISAWSKDSVAFLIFRNDEFPATQGYIKNGRKVVVCLNDGGKLKGRIILDSDTIFTLRDKNDSMHTIKFSEASQIKKVRRFQNSIGFTYLTAGISVWAYMMINNAQKPAITSLGEGEGRATTNGFSIFLGSILNSLAILNTHKKKFEPNIFHYKVIRYKCSSPLTKNPSRTQIIQELK